MKIVFTDAKTIGDDLDLSAFDALGQVVKYDFTAPDELSERAADADVLILNKTAIHASVLGPAPHLKLICVTGTGTNHLDKDFLAKRGIAWRNVENYSTESVTQHTFAMLFYLLEKMAFYDDYVKSGDYAGDTLFSHYKVHFRELSHMTFGIIGLGHIGRRVAHIAEAFGAHVIYCSPSGAEPQEGYTQTDFHTLLSESDIVSIHAPLNAHTENLMNREAFQRMKPNAILLNLGRGPIVNEADLQEALCTGEIAAAGLDVLSQEPMREHHPLLQIKDSTKLLITPHIGWAGLETRKKLMDILCGQIRDFFS